jgi:regulator of protease activity HflC (stomatin/prohibitin superfamily)
VTIPAGHGGALWLRFFGGTIVAFHYDEGTKLIFPWDKIYVYDLRIQQRTKKFEVLTKEGLHITIEATLMFRVNPRAVGVITKYAGPDFADTLVMPSVGALVRLKAGRFTLEEVYSTHRKEVERGILQQFRKTVDVLIGGVADGDPEIIVEDFWFSGIELPAALQTSIEGKLTQRQLAEQYAFILEREEQERKRKVIEAQGIREFQDIVSGGISENYLKWKGIDATLKLADSPNAKVVVIGSGKDGLPLILGPWDGAVPGQPAGGGGAATKPAAGAGAGPEMPLPPPVGLVGPR